MITNKCGWRPLKAIDLRTTTSGPGTCERCGRNNLRFVHTVEHPQEGRLQVGCECARRLCYGYSPEREERRLQKLWARRSRWLTRNWGTSHKGNSTLKFKHDRERIRITIFANRFGAWSYCIAAGGETFFPRENYASADDAKLGAFDFFAEVAGWGEPEQELEKELPAGLPVAAQPKNGGRKA